MKTREIQTINEVVLQHANNNPDGLAYIFLQNGKEESERLTYQQLAAKSELLAMHLVKRGSFGDRVILMIPSSTNFMVAYLACLFAGQIPVPLPDPPFSNPVDRLLHVVADCQAKIVLVYDDWVAGLQSALESKSAGNNLELLAINDLIDHPITGVSLPKVNADDLCLLQYTSGSTARPRGVMVSHQNLIANLRVINKIIQPNYDDKFIGWLPLFHDMGLIGQNLNPLFNGFLCIFMPPLAFIRRPLNWLEAISNYRGTISTAPNFGYEICVEKIASDEKSKLDLNSWKLVLNGAEPVRAQTLDRFEQAFASCGFRSSFWRPVYGLAENTLFVSGSEDAKQPTIYSLNLDALKENRIEHSRKDDENIRLVGCGTIPEQQQVIIVCPETGKQCPPDQIGEIWVAGPCVAQGYWGNPVATQETFHAYTSDGWGPYLRTGDLGVFVEQELVIAGRIKDLIIIQGKNYYPQDIELVVELAHPANRAGNGVAFSVDIADSERLVIVQEVNRKVVDDFDEQQVLAMIKQAIAREYGLRAYAILLTPRAVVKKTSSGKKMRNFMRQQFLAGNITSLFEWRAPD